MRTRHVAIIIALILITVTAIQTLASVSITGLTLNKTIFNEVDTPTITVTYTVSPPSPTWTNATIRIYTSISNYDKSYILLLERPTTITGVVTVTDTISNTISIQPGTYVLTVFVVAVYQALLPYYDGDTYTTQITVTGISTATQVNATTNSTTSEVVIGGRTYTITTWSHNPPHSLASVIYSQPPQLKLASITLLILVSIIVSAIIIRRTIT